MWDKDIILQLLKRPPDFEHDDVWYWWPELIKRGRDYMFGRLEYRFVKARKKDQLCNHIENGYGQSLPDEVQEQYLTYLMDNIILKDED